MEPRLLSSRPVPRKDNCTKHHCMSPKQSHSRRSSTCILRYNVCQVGEVNYTVSEFLGGWYRHENANRIHSNWINMAVEELFNPVVGRALTKRPLLAKIRVTAANSGPVLNCNSYSAMLNITGDSLAPLSAMMDYISKFIESAKLGSKALLHTSGDASGTSCLSHSLEPPTLPTWHNMPTATHSRPALVQNVEYTVSNNSFPADEFDANFNV